MEVKKSVERTGKLSFAHDGICWGSCAIALLIDKTTSPGQSENLALVGRGIECVVSIVPLQEDLLFWSRRAV